MSNQVAQPPSASSDPILCKPAGIINQGRRQIFDTPLSTQRYDWVLEYLKNDSSIKSVTDFGCGSARLHRWLKSVPHLETVNFVDSDRDLLEHVTSENLRPILYDALFGRQCTDKSLAMNLFCGDITVPDDRLMSDCFLMVELIEHLLPEVVEGAVRSVFDYYRPRFVVVTTPNSEFNHLLREPGEPEGKFRHSDHKFEWSRAQFVTWCQSICNNYSYSVRYDGVGHLPTSGPYGPCTQIAVFKRDSEHREDRDLRCFDMIMEKLNVNDEHSMHRPLHWKEEKQPSEEKPKYETKLLQEYTIPGKDHLDKILKENAIDSANREADSDDSYSDEYDNDNDNEIQYEQLGNDTNSTNNNNNNDTDNTVDLSGWT